MKTVSCLNLYILLYFCLNCTVVSNLQLHSIDVSASGIDLKRSESHNIQRQLSRKISQHESPKKKMSVADAKEEDEVILKVLRCGHIDRSDSFSASDSDMGAHRNVQ